jgi:hypothetical protein
MKKLFELPSDLVAEFSELLVENELVNELQGRTENDDVLIEVCYRSSQRDAIQDIEEWLTENLEEDGSDED